MLVARSYAQEFGEVWVIVGPVFGEQSGSLSAGVRIPVACYKIIVREERGRPEVLAFLIPQDVDASGRAEEFMATVREIEAMTGLDFLSELPDEIEDRIESERSSALWQSMN